ncbi:MAG: hypothetical protein NTW05_05925 [Pseudonocardiales bacterium]|nr:hypothetical protein [Pseudonocardiales bacterium]
MVDQREHRARRMWRALEPVHAVTYFAPESRAAAEALGVRGFWRGYFALRAAPLGPVPAEVVTALFHTFHPAFVARAVPAVWDVAPPEALLRARLDGVDAALRRLLGTDVVAGPALAEAAGIAREAALAAPTAGRGLAAANAALDWPDAPHLVLWHAQTLLRESRGDGHTAVLLAAGLDPVEALVVFDADVPVDDLRERRGRSAEEWAAARERLTRRGLLAGSGLSDAGRALRAEVEARTDALADVSWQAVGDARAERLVELAAPLVAAIVSGGAFLDRNPMGLRPLAPAG